MEVTVMERKHHQFTIQKIAEEDFFMYPKLKILYKGSNFEL